MRIQISRLNRWLFIMLVGLMAGTLLLAPPIFAQEKSVVWERFDVDINVNQDSSFDVTEEQEIRFLQGEFTFGTRYIPIVNFDSLDNWSLTDSQGNVYTQNETGAPYTFSVDDNGYQYDIRWNFPPIANDVETYYLSYTVLGGLRFYEGGDQVWWKAIYGDRSFPVLEGTVNVSVPSPATVDEYAAYINGADARDSATATLAEDQRSALFNLTRTLQAGEDFEVRVQFTDGVIAGAPAAWQQRADEEAAQREADQAFYDFWGPASTLFFGAIGFLLLLGGPAVLYALWYRFGRDKPVEMVADYLPEPPDSLAPGVAGTLLDEQADMEDIIATMVDLARRKAISITEDKQDGIFRSGTDFIYRRERDDVPLSTYEQKLLDGMFKGERMVELSDLKEKFYDKLPGIKTALYDAAIEEGLFPRNPATVRRVYQILGVIGLIGSFWVAMVMRIAFSSLTGAAVLPGVGLGATALGLIILSRHMPRKTDKGAEAAARWQAFKNYLKDIDQYADMESQKALWDQWLPYAIAFGVDKQYIRSFESVETPAPGWYIPSPTLYGPMRPWYYGTPGSGPVSTGGGGLGDVMSGPSGQGGGMGGGLSQASRGMGTSLAGMSVGLGSMLNSASSTMTSRPASSSSSGGWSSGGGGFSGGGSFGGGGGGGGGGGFG